MEKSKFTFGDVAVGYYRMAGLFSFGNGKMAKSPSVFKINFFFCRFFSTSS